MSSIFTILTPGKSLAQCEEREIPGTDPPEFETICGDIQPKITSPANGFTTSNKRPEIKFRVDNTQSEDLKNIKLYLDNVMVLELEGNEANTTEYSWIPENDLDLGLHAVKVYAREEKDGGAAEQTSEDTGFRIETNKITVAFVMDENDNGDRVEGDTEALRIRINGTLDEAIVINTIANPNFMTPPGVEVAVENQDFRVVSNPLNLEARVYDNETFNIGTLEIIDDILVEGRGENAEAFGILTTPDNEHNNNIDESGMAMFMIQDVDKYKLSITGVNGAEPDQDFKFIASLNTANLEGGMSFFYETSGTASSNDFNCTGSPGFNIPINTLSIELTNCHVHDDLEVEGDETVIMTPFPPEEDDLWEVGDIIPALILDNDFPPTTGHSGKSHKTTSSKKVCKDSKALNFNNVGQHKQSLCKYGKKEEKEEKVEERQEEKSEHGEEKKGNIFKCNAKYLGDDILEAKSSKDVLKLQEFLNKYEGEKLEENGEYNELTINAVNRYQIKYKRDILFPWRLTKPNGKVFSTMRGHINNRYRVLNGCEETCTMEKRFTKYLRLGSKGVEVEKVQNFLSELGFYKGVVDGIFGPSTKEAVKNFQNENWEYVLKPWGIPCKCGTGYWYQSTVHYANQLIGCKGEKPKLKHGKEPIACVLKHFPNFRR